MPAVGEELRRAHTDVHSNAEKFQTAAPPFPPFTSNERSNVIFDRRLCPPPPPSRASTPRIGRVRPAARPSFGAEPRSDSRSPDVRRRTLTSPASSSCLPLRRHLLSAARVCTAGGRPRERHQQLPVAQDQSHEAGPRDRGGSDQGVHSRGTFLSRCLPLPSATRSASPVALAPAPLRFPSHPHSRRNPRKPAVGGLPAVEYVSDTASSTDSSTRRALLDRSKCSAARTARC